MDPAAAARPAYVPELDGLRALAAFAVAAFHCRAPFASSGFLGVDVFFVLSGWLITGILAREIERAGRIDVRAFLVRRIRRLYPALLFMVACLLFAAPAIWPDALAAATYVMDFYALAAGREHIILHTWSLAVEAQFYLLWPFALAGLLRFGRARAAAVLALAWLAVSVGRALAAAFGAPAPVLYFLPVFHCTGLLLGSALALTDQRLARLPLAGWLGLALVLGAFALSATLSEHAPPMTALPLAEIAAALIILAPPKVLAWRPLVAAGTVSYAFYLWHFMFAFSLPAVGWPMRLAITVAGGLALATVSYWLVERRWLVRGRPAAAASRPAGVRLPLVD